MTTRGMFMPSTQVDLLHLFGDVNEEPPVEWIADCMRDTRAKSLLMTLEPWRWPEGDALTRWRDALDPYDASVRYMHEANGDWYPWGSKCPAREQRREWARFAWTFRKFPRVWSPNVMYGDVGLGWTPPSSQYDVFALDGYNFGDVGGWQFPFDLFTRSVVEARTITDKPLWIAETGCERGPSRKAWLGQLNDLLLRHDIGACCYFNLNKERMWALQDRESRLFLHAECPVTHVEAP